MSYSAEIAEKHIAFLQCLNLTGDFYGHPLVLQDWQKEVIRDVYGTVNERGLRQYQYAYLEIPKKNGKSELIASLAIDHCFLDEPGGQIYCCAAEREQASLVYQAAKSKIEQDPYLEKAFRVVDSKKEIYNRNTGTFIKVLSAEAYSKHGLNPSVVIFDELHAVQKRDIWDVMTFGTGAARQEQLIWVITTAGDDPNRNSIGWEVHDYADRIRRGEIEDQSWYARIFCADPDDDIWDEKTWYKANPSLGVTINIENVRKEAQQAKNSPAAEKNFRWLRLNQWISLKRTSWLPLELWDSTEIELNRDSLRGEACYIGVDLSSTTDLTALCALFPPNERSDQWRFILDTFVPTDRIHDKVNVDHVPYDVWAQTGIITATDGDSVDYSVVARHIDDWCRMYNVKYISADKWRIEYLSDRMSADVVSKVVTIPQTIEGMSPAMKEIERMARSGELKHEVNPCGRWAWGNVIVAMDGNENLKPHKGRSIDRIDPIVALINAMAAAIRMEKKVSAYEAHGIRSL